MLRGGKAGPKTILGRTALVYCRQNRPETRVGRLAIPLPGRRERRDGQ